MDMGVSFTSDQRPVVPYTGYGRKTWQFLSPIILALVWGGVMQLRSVASWFHAISVATEQWTAQHRAFVVEVYFKNGDSAITTRLFRRHFNIPRHGRVPWRNTIIEWVQNFRENVLALKRNPRGRIPTVRTPENVDKASMAIVKSLRRSVRRHSAAVGLSVRSVRRILHKDLNFHP